MKSPTPGRWASPCGSRTPKSTLTPDRPLPPRQPGPTACRLTVSRWLRPLPTPHPPQASLGIGAMEALRSVHDRPDLVLTVVTGNLKLNALLKLAVFDLGGYVDTEIGAFASDDQHRLALVAVAQKRAQAKHGTIFTRSNTVIIGDSLEDVRTGLEGGAAVVAVASGKTQVTTLREAGADVLLGTLENVQELHYAIASVVQLRL
ncbi:HAD hydrolase-like protein [Streptomyces spongiicola]